MLHLWAAFPLPKSRYDPCRPQHHAVQLTRMNNLTLSMKHYGDASCYAIIIAPPSQLFCHCLYGTTIIKAIAIHPRSILFIQADQVQNISDSPSAESLRVSLTWCLMASLPPNRPSSCSQVLWNSKLFHQPQAAAPIICSSHQCKEEMAYCIK